METRILTDTILQQVTDTLILSGYDPADFYSDRYPDGKRWTDLAAEALKDSWKVEERGLNGRKIPDPAYDAGRIENLLGELRGNDVFAVMLGTNDLLSSLDPDAEIPVRRMDRFLAFLEGKIVYSQVLIIAPPYIGSGLIRDPLFSRFYEESRKMNEGFAHLAASYGTMFVDAALWDIDLSADHVHFSEKGHGRFAAGMAGYLQNLN